MSSWATSGSDSEVRHPSEVADLRSEGKYNGHVAHPISLNPEELTFAVPSRCWHRHRPSVQFHPPILCNFTPPLTQTLRNGIRLLIY
jgi:hypothetical protein